MCRIFAIVRHHGEVAPDIRAGLKRLEYGGYDSAGIATTHQGHLFIKKDAGRIDDISARLDLDSMPGSVGIGHTRWATHGGPSRSNAHPQTDCKQQIALVHNGIIENFLTLKKELQDKGHEFVSKTDTEVVAHLAEQYVKDGMAFREACLKVARTLQGSFALAILSTHEPNTVACIRKDSPLLIGTGKDGNYCASDVVAFLDHTRQAIPLESGDMALIAPDRYETVRFADGKQVERKEFTISWTTELAQKEGYPHFMLKEIFEQPRSLRYVLGQQNLYLDLLSELLDRARNVFLVAAGTSYHSCLAATYLYSKLAALPTTPVVASEFVSEYGGAVNVDTAILFVSQSGETADVLQAAEYGRLQRAATVLGVCNVLGSTLTRVARAYVLQQSGPEIGVAATKTYTAQLLVHTLLAMRLARKRGKISQVEADELDDAVKTVPSVAQKVLDNHRETAMALAKKYAGRPCFYFLGKGVNTATALEGRLKLLEIAYVPSIAYPAGESKHGPISLVEKGFPVVFTAPRDETRQTIMGNIMEMKARGATVITIGQSDDSELAEQSDEYLAMPDDIPAILTPIFYVMPLQLFAYYAAVQKGLDPDKPRNLAKSVTVV